MSEDLPEVTIYTDGGCRPNPGPGGWGAVLLYRGRDPVELSGGQYHLRPMTLTLQPSHTDRDTRVQVEVV